MHILASTKVKMNAVDVCLSQLLGDKNVVFGAVKTDHDVITAIHAVTARNMIALVVNDIRMTVSLTTSITNCNENRVDIPASHLCVGDTIHTNGIHKYTVMDMRKIVGDVDVCAVFTESGTLTLNTGIVVRSNTIPTDIMQHVEDHDT